MTNRSKDIQHWSKLLARHRQNVQILREQLAVFAEGDKPLHLLNQLDAEENAIREAKAALRKLEEQPDQLPGDPEESDEAIPAPSLSPEHEGELQPPQPKPLPQINAPNIELEDWERTLLRHVYRDFGFKRVSVEREFGGGYSGTRVLLTEPVETSDRRAARMVTKLGPALELRNELDNYQIVKKFLPFRTAPVEGYYEQEDQAALNYVFVGGGALGDVVTLEEYYREAASSQDVERVAKTLDDLLDKELGERWYGQHGPLNHPFAAEYGRHMVEQLRLRLRRASSDRLWPVGQPPAPAPDYRQIAMNDILYRYGEVKKGELLSVEGLIVKRIKRGEVKLQAPGGEGIVVRVEFEPESDVARRLKLEDRVGVRGEVVYNRSNRMEEILHAVFPNLVLGGDSDSVELPGVTGTYPNPLRIYPQLLSKNLERKSYVHGDLHLRNVLVDKSGTGWLIDFARVEERHNLFDFIKLETYVRLMVLANITPPLPLCDYFQFEEALNDDTLGKGEAGETCPKNPDLQFAYQVIRAIRRIARKYMGPTPDFRDEYFSALFLYCLAVMKYYQEDAPQPTRLAFATAMVLGRYLPGIGDSPCSPATSVTPRLPSIAAPLVASRRRVVMAGVNDYQDRDISNLTCCVADVRAVHRLLTDPAHGDYQARLLLDTTPDTLPTRNNILAELHNVAQAADEADLLLFYFSGHGIAEAGEAYLIPYDARLTNLTDTAIPLRRVKDIMAKSAARAKVIILDACHSGARIGKAEARMSPEFMQRAFAEAEGLAILASCQQGQVSYEWEQAGQSVFTHFLLEGLAGAADFDNKRFVTIQDINRYVADRVKDWAVECGRSQTPTLGGGWSGDIVLTHYRDRQT